MDTLGKVLQEGTKALALMPEILENKELEGDIAFTELLSVVAYFTIEAYNDLVEYYEIMS